MDQCSKRRTAEIATQIKAITCDGKSDLSFAMNICVPWKQHTSKFHVIENRSMGSRWKNSSSVAFYRCFSINLIHGQRSKLIQRPRSTCQTTVHRLNTRKCLRMVVLVFETHLKRDKMTIQS